MVDPTVFADKHVSGAAVAAGCPSTARVRHFRPQILCHQTEKMWLENVHALECFGEWAQWPTPPAAMCYVGHQFGQLNKGLGDGRGFLWGQYLAPSTDADDLASSRLGLLREIHVKGSGKTPFARGHDGRMTLCEAVHEMLISEGLHRAGVPTHRVLAIVETVTGVRREKTREGDVAMSTLRGAVLVRHGHCYLRIGSFERWLHLHIPPAAAAARLRELASYLQHHCYPDIAVGDFRFLFASICNRLALLAALYEAAGFVHG